MMRTRMLVHLILLPWLSLVDGGEVYAVGFCNIVKASEVQKQLGVATAEFYRGAGALATMLVGVEEGNLEQVEKAGVVARDAFGAASERYAEVIGSGVVGGDFTEAVAAVDVKEALQLAPVPETDPVITKIGEFAERGEVNEMLAICSEQSKLLAEKIDGVREYATEKALGELQQRPFLELSNLWGQTLVYGTFVSAIFAVAEGESP